MSTWTAPITFSSGSVLTAAQMNTEVRDHALFLKGALDLITNSTTADTGTATLLRIVRASASDEAFGARVTGDSVNRLNFAANGDAVYGPGSGGGDTKFRRTAAGNLILDANATANDTRLSVQATSGQRSFISLNVSGDSFERLLLAGDATLQGLAFGGGTGATDVQLNRSAADTLRTPDGFWAEGGLVTKTKAGVPTDADLVAGMTASGAHILDTTNSRAYWRVGTTWKFAALT